MEIAEHVDALRRQGQWLADAAERAGLDATVPPCAPWQVKDLLRHTGYVHRWAARHITECPDQIIDGPSEEDILRGGADDAGLLAWFRDGHAALARTLATADPAMECPTFMAAPCPLAFWARRQAHETAIHRADAESAADATPEYEAGFAADGVDELIMGFGRRRKYQPGSGPKTAEGARLRAPPQGRSLTLDVGRIIEDTECTDHRSVAGAAAPVPAHPGPVACIGPRGVARARAMAGAGRVEQRCRPATRH